jgi:hypothetical protein
MYFVSNDEEDSKAITKEGMGARVRLYSGKRHLSHVAYSLGLFLIVSFG